ncbi:RND transporter [Halomonas sp. DQ26W]|uniref:efflux RND transporter permease subunit n=1 Tax=Halomonas sp. DQ26W TaxID=2282311 RepID=UPI000DF7F067|nr:MMPL family transporter [Halomonas sp. DQ26W]RDB41876.1 RND transporter [Halomonas sp. DQ26W]RDB42382.1 RND transporter [Halomonas sp. DQ26W]
MGKTIARFSMRHYRRVFLALLVLVVALGALIPRIVIDTDPENMLATDQPARVFDARVAERFDLYDTIVVGLVSERPETGIYHPESLAGLHALTRAIQAMDGVVADEVMSLATVDNVEQISPGTISFDWLMGTPPETPEAAAELREAVERLPMFLGSLVSEDGRAAGIFVPLEDKNDSHRIATQIEAVVGELGIEEVVHITGQPVAQDTFGVQMFEQMAISAPLAGLLIFVVMVYFFRSVPLVVAPMLLAMATVIATMGLLIGLGYTVHIMSSMIPIFLMPIAVVDSVHVMSDFSDRCRAGSDPREVMAEVIQELYKPIVFTSLTTSVGFASLMLSPIPPVQVFGAFVAFGVLLAMVLSLTFLPAYVAALPASTIEAMVARVHRHEREGTGADCRLCRFVTAVGRLATRRGRVLLVLFLGLLGVAVYGITQIQINDNPTRWFKSSHDIRIADRVLNQHFAGTYEAYLVLEDRATGDLVSLLSERAEPVLAEAGVSLETEWASLLAESRGADAQATLDNLMFAIDDRLFAVDADAARWWERLLEVTEALRSEALTFQDPEILRYLADLQAHLETEGVVGKANSLADLVRTVNRELVSGEAVDFRIPDSAAGVAQAILSYQSSHRPGDLWHFVASDYRSANVWLQLPSGDNQDMQRLLAAVDAYVDAYPLPEGLALEWAGSTYINLVWQGEMVKGMLLALLSAFAVVLVMMVGLFRSLWYGVLAMLPLTLTVSLLYGVMGLIGKDFDMPVAVLSALSLGLSVDFAIHFIQRLREAVAEAGGDWREGLARVFEEPARAITRNAIVIALGFTPLLVAPLMPYVTVGIFLASIMAVSAMVTLLMLPAVVSTWPRRFFGTTAAVGAESGSATGKEV